MGFWELLTLAGMILGLAAALDYLVKDPAKALIAQNILHLGRRTPVVGYGISSYLDRAFFGPRLGSARAWWISALLSLLSLTFAYVFAYVTSESSLVNIFSHDPSWKSLWIFLFFLLGCIIGDFFSFAQTRIFLRTVDNTKSGIVTIGLALADAVISLAIFVGTFSVIRLAAYLIILSTSSQGLIKQEQEINTAAVGFAVQKIISEGLAFPSEVEWASFISKVKSVEDASVVDELTRRYTNDLVKEHRSDDIVSVQVSFSCSGDPYILMSEYSEEVRLISKNIAGARGIELDGSAFINLEKDVLKRILQWRSTDEKCKIPTLNITQSLTPAGLLSVAGLWNALWASFERTLYDFYTNFGFKLAIYSSVNPESDIGLFYRSLIQQTEHGLLGLSYGDHQIYYALSEFSYSSPEDTEPLQIPFSPMLASCLTVSMFFWIYILTIYASRISRFFQIYIERVKNNFRLSAAPFTFIGLGLNIFLLSGYLLIWGLATVWSILFGSFA